MQGLSVAMHIALQASESPRVADADASVLFQERPHDIVGPLPASPSLDAASKTVPP